MKCLFLNIYYEDFLREHYRKNKIDHLEYMEQWDSIQGSLFGDSDFYSFNLEKLGWQAHDLITNCKQLQKRWAVENDYHGGHPVWVEQIIRYKPDVVYSQGLWLINDKTHPMIRESCKLIVGHVGSQLDNFYTDKYDLIFRNVPNYVNEFHKAGVESHYMPMAFDMRVWSWVKGNQRIYPVTFVGNITAGHQRRKDVLAKLRQKYNGHVFREWIGELWGMDMFKVLSQSYITINCNIDFCQPNVGNMRIFEGTGCGAAMVTDYGDNIHELFAEDEISVYKNPDEAVECVDFLLANFEIREAKAQAGQKRTFKDHTYENRMSEMADIFESMI